MKTLTVNASKDGRLKSIAHTRSVYDIFLCVYEGFRVEEWKRYVNDDRLRVDGALRWLHVYRVVLDELLNETGHGSPIVLSKFRIVIDKVDVSFWRVTERSPLCDMPKDGFEGD